MSNIKKTTVSPDGFTRQKTITLPLPGNRTITIQTTIKITITPAGRKEKQ